MQLQAATWNWANISHCRTWHRSAERGASPGETCCKIYIYEYVYRVILAAHKSGARWTGKYLSGIKTAIEIEIAINNWPTPTNQQLNRWRRPAPHAPRGSPFFFNYNCRAGRWPNWANLSCRRMASQSRECPNDGFVNWWKALKRQSANKLRYISANNLWYISIVSMGKSFNYFVLPIR